jgi:two-component sensor histidine kinase
LHGKIIPSFLYGGGEMAAAIVDLDWAATPLGAISTWSPTLRITVGLMLNSKFPKCIFWGTERTLLYNDAYRPLLGEKPAPLGRSLAETWPEIIDEVEPLVDLAMQGQATFIEDFPLIVDRHGYDEQCWFTFCYSPVRDPDGVVEGMLNTVIETTAKVEAVRNARLLNEELSHRIKNTLAIVSAIAHQSYRSADTKDEAHGVLNQRLVALGQAHSVLTQSSWHGAPIELVVQNALLPHVGQTDHIDARGPPAMLSPKQALSLSLSLHELATNALKYGALSSENGRVRIRWTTGAPGSDDPFEFCWEESGGPRVALPRRRGFGSRLIKSSLAQEFGGKVDLDFCPDGVVCTLRTRMAMLKGED